MSLSSTTTNNGRGANTARQFGTLLPNKDPLSTHVKVAAPRPKQPKMTKEEQLKFFRELETFISGVQAEEEADAITKEGGGDDKDQSHAQV